MGNEFDFTRNLEESMKITAKDYVELWERARREDKEFFEAWDKRATEVMELERLWKL